MGLRKLIAKMLRQRVAAKSATQRQRNRRRLVHESMEERRLMAIDLGTLAPADGSAFYGAAAGDMAGMSVSKVGDVNGDGFDDIFIGATGADRTGQSNAGASYLVFGSPTLPAQLDLANLGSAGVRLLGIDASDSTGSAVAGADVNGDGYSDLIVGASGADGVGGLRPNSGETYVIFGSPTLPSVIDLAIAGSANLTIYGASSGDISGSAVAGVGDFNGDGYDDFLIGAQNADGVNEQKAGSGESYLIYGAATLPTTMDLASLAASQGTVFFGVDANDASGVSVGGAGDVNGDGLDDLLIGAVYGNGPTNSLLSDDTGESYLVFGTRTRPAAVNLNSLGTGAAGVTLYGADANELSGIAVSGAGDVNGDGYDDFLVGSFLSDGPLNASFAVGVTHLIFGSASLPNVLALDSLGPDGVAIYGSEYFDSAGWAVSSAGDVNADGFDDLLIAATYPDNQPTASYDAKGKTFVVYGAAQLDWQIDLGTLAASGIAYIGDDAGDTSGWSVSGAGDVNGDGFGDFLIGAPTADGQANGKINAGETYLLYGGRQSSAVTHPGTTSGDNLTGTGAANVINGGRGNDTLLSAGGADVLFGGEGDDVFSLIDLDFARITAGNGSDTLRFDAADLVLDLTAFADNRLLGIEQIDLNGTGSNTLILNDLELLNLSTESNTLIVRMGADDVIEYGSGWIDGGVQVAGGNSYRVFTKGAATLKLQSANQAPTAVVLSNVISLLPENTSTANRVKVADITITDDGRGVNQLSLTGPSSAAFEIFDGALYIKAGTTLDFESLSQYVLTVQVDDASVGLTPDATAAYVLNLSNVNEAPTLALSNVISSLPENSNTSSPTRLADIVVVDDGLGGGVLSLSGADASSFELFFAPTGPQLRLRSGVALNFEAKQVYDVIINIDDNTLGSGIDASVAYQLNVGDVNEPVVLTVNNASVSGAVGTTITNSGTWFDPEGGSVTLTATVGTVTMNPNGTWSWSHVPNVSVDNQTITISAMDVASTTTLTFAFRSTQTLSVLGGFFVYNNSAWDGNGLALSSADLAAIPSDKVALVAGQTATYANYTNYSRGITGVAIDLLGLEGAAVQPSLASLADYFSFRQGRTNLPTNWSVAPAPREILVLNGMGVNGSSRVLFSWNLNEIRNTWLEVTVLPTPVTRMQSPVKLYFGNAVAEVGNSTTDARVNATDVVLIQSNPRGFSNPAPITFPYDIDRDRRVNGIDVTLAQNNVTTFVSQLPLIRPPQ